MSAELYAQSYQFFVSAAEKFAKVKSDSPAYDFAVVNVANNYTQAQRLVAEDHGPEKDPAKSAALAQDLAAKALAAYDKYDKYEGAHPTTEEKILSHRKMFRGAILLARNSLYLGAGDYEKALENGADEYLAWEQENTAAKEFREGCLSQ